MEPADVFAAVVRRASDERLEALMRGPLRRFVLEGIFHQMPRQVDAERARDLRASIRWCVTGRPDGKPDVYQLDFDGGSCTLVRAPTGRTPQVTITLDGAELVRIAAGLTNPTRAYFGGRVGLAGDVMLAARLGTLFKVPASRG